jgi:hypothetical protein
MRDRVILSMLGGSNSARSGSVSWAWRERVIGARSDRGSRYMEGKGHRCGLCMLGGTGSCMEGQDSEDGQENWIRSLFG